jgi:hypothetical protein
MANTLNNVKINKNFLLLNRENLKNARGNDMVIKALSVFGSPNIVYLRNRNCGKRTNWLTCLNTSKLNFTKVKVATTTIIIIFITADELMIRPVPFLTLYKASTINKANPILNAYWPNQCMSREWSEFK